MTLLREAGKTVIGKVRTTSRSSDALVVKLRLGAALSTVDLRPSGLPPSAIVCIRALRDPLPGSLRLHAGATRVHTAWEQAIQNRLADLCRRAARPRRGYVDASAEAVIFADEGEMLACLALDISRGQAWGRWWWQTILRTLPTDSLRTLLCRQTRHLPAALYHLTRWGQAPGVIAALSTEQVLTVFSAVSQAHGLGGIDTIPIHPQEALSDEAANTKDAQGKKKHSGSGEHQSRDSPELERPAALAKSEKKAPWEDWFPPALVPRSLAKEKAALLGIGLSLYHRPASVRGRAFQEAFRDWWVDSRPPPSTRQNLPISPSSQANRRSDGAPSKDRSASQTEQERIHIVEEIDTEKKQSDLPRQMGLNTGLQQDHARDATPHLSETSPPVPHPTSEASAVNEARPRQIQTPTVIKPREPDLLDDVEPQAPLKKEPTLHLESGVATQAGGVLYLLNLMQHLDIPACFEETWRLASQVGPWGILEALARVLLGCDGEHLAEDPIWQALTKLDGRKEGELPGDGLSGNNDFRLPTSWPGQIEAEQNSTWYWAATRQRLRLWSSTGYLVVDCPRSGDGSAPSTLALMELESFLSGIHSTHLSRRPFAQAPLEDITCPLTNDLNKHLACWLSRVLPYIRLWLRQTLKMSTGNQSTLAQTLLLHPGHLYVTSTHVDLVMHLEDISLPVRIAGLDRDPGWLPDFARVVQFHFE